MDRVENEKMLDVKDADRNKMTSDVESVSRRFSILKTIFLVITWICFGMMMEITGPTLQDLKYRTGSTYEAIASAISARGFGTFLGSVVGGLLIDKLGRFCDLMNCGWFVLIAVLVIAIPWTLEIAGLWAIFFIIGVAAASLNVGSEKILLQMWKKKVTSPMHAFHLGFGIGSFIVPLVSNPFLVVFAHAGSENITRFCVNLTTEISMDNKSMILQNCANVTQHATNATSGVIKDSMIEYAYGIVAIPAFIVALIYLLYQICFYRELNIEYKTKDQKTQSLKNIFNPASCAGGNFAYGSITFILIFFFFFNCAGIQRFYSNFIRTYSIDALGFSKDDGSYINSVFWIAFSVGRFTGIIVGKLISTPKLVIIEIIGLFLSSLVFVIFHHIDPTNVGWTCTVLLGFFIGPLYPTGVAFADYHVQLTGIGIMIINFGDGIGSLVCIWLAGYCYDNYGPESFRYLNLSLGIFTLIIGLMQLLFGRRQGSRFAEQKKQTVNEKLDSTNL